MAEQFADEDLDRLEQLHAGQPLDVVDLWRLTRLGLISSWPDGDLTRAGYRAICRRRLAGRTVHIDAATDRRVYKADGTALR